MYPGSIVVIFQILLPLLIAAIAQLESGFLIIDAITTIAEIYLSDRYDICRRVSISVIAPIVTIIWKSGLVIDQNQFL